MTMSSSAATIRKLRQQLARERAARICAARRNPHKKRKGPSKETQIKMVKGALASKKTPRHLLPSLRKRLQKLAGTAVLIMVACLCASVAHAQNSLLSVNQLVIKEAIGPQVTPNSIAIGCVATPVAPCGVQNLNQTIHTITYLINGTCTTPTLDLRIEASNDGITFFQLSQDALDIPTNPVSQTALSGGVTATGSFPVLRVNLGAFSCGGGGTIRVWYSGYSTAAPPNSAIFQQANIGRQILWQNVPTNTVLGSLQVSTPFENASGSIWILCAAACPSGMSISVAALPLVNVPAPPSFALTTIAVATVTGWQRFDITNASTNVLQLTVTPGAAGTTWTALYNFVPSSSQVNGGLNVNCVNGCSGGVSGGGLAIEIG